MNLLNFNEFRDQCHNASRDAGWWKNAERYTNTIRYSDPDRLTIPTKLCLVHSEISEMHDAYRTGAPDDHLPEWPGAQIEGGDTLIRIGDVTGYLNVDMSAAIALVLQADHIEISEMGWAYWSARSKTPYIGIDGWFSLLHTFTSGAMEGYRKSAADTYIPSLSAFAAYLARIVILLDLIAQRNEWDMDAAAQAKIAYNAVRLDHKAEARAADGGKAF